MTDHEKLIQEIKRETAEDGYIYDFSQAYFIEEIGYNIIGENKVVELHENFREEGKIVAIITNVFDKEGEDLTFFVVFLKDLGNYYVVENTLATILEKGVENDVLIEKIKEYYSKTNPDFDFTNAKFTNRVGDLCVGAEDNFDIDEGETVSCLILAILTGIKNSKGTDMTILTVESRGYGVCYVDDDTHSFVVGTDIRKN